MKTSVVLLFLWSSLLFSQLKDSRQLIWERTEETSRNRNNNCDDYQLLNFHCSIDYSKSFNQLTYHKDKSHSLILVHARKKDQENSLIWKNKSTAAELEESKYFKPENKDPVPLLKQPSLFSYIAPADPEALQNLKDSVQIERKTQDIYELIFTQKRIKPSDLQKIHSYLSIKYGISLSKGKYVDSDGKTIWDPKKNKNYLYRLTGIGRDDSNELYQKQSSNQEDLILTISLGEIQNKNVENRSVIPDRNFLVWADNNKDLKLTKKQDLIALNREWKLNFIGKELSRKGYVIRIIKSLLNPDDNRYLEYLAILDNETDEHRFMGEEVGNYIIFRNIEFDLNKDNSALLSFAVKSGISKPNEEIRFPEKDEFSSQNILLYPNPVRPEKDFHIVFPPIKGLVIDIFDTSGRKISSTPIEPEATHFTSQLRVQGMYIINIVVNGKTLKTLKLLVE